MGGCFDRSVKEDKYNCLSFFSFYLIELYCITANYNMLQKIY